MQCTQIKPTIWLESFDRAVRGADDDDDDDDDDNNDVDDDDDDDCTCESAIGVRRGDDELI